MRSGRQWRYAPNPGVSTHLDLEALTKEERELLEEYPDFELDETYRKDQIAARIVAAGPRPFRTPTSAGGWVFVHPDLKHPGSWRATYFDDDGDPWSHTEFPRDTSEESFAATLKDLRLDAKFDRMEWYVGNPEQIDPLLYEY